MYGWDSLPALPRALHRLADAANVRLVSYTLDHDDAALPELAKLYADVVAHDEFASCTSAARAQLFNRAGVTHNWLGVKRGSGEALEESVRLLEAGLREPEADPVLRGRLQSNIANGRVNVYYLRGSRQSLADAAQAVTEALSLVEHVTDERGRIVRARALVNWCAVLRAQHRDSGRTDRLDTAVDTARSALADAVTDDIRTIVNTTLADLLAVRYDANGVLADLDEAIELVRATLDSDDPRIAPGVKGTLGSYLRRRFVRTSDPVDLDEAIRWLRDGLDLESSPPPRLTNYGNAMLDRYHAHGDRADLLTALEVQRAAVDRTPEGDWQLASRWNNAGNAASVAAAVLGDTDLLDEAIDRYRRSLHLTHEDAPERASREYNLANALMATWTPQTPPAHTREIRDEYAAAVRHGLDGSLEWALAAATTWARWAGDRCAWSESAEAYARAIDVVRRIFRIQLFRDDRQTWLSLSQGLPADAAYAMVRAGRAADAVDALESARALLLSDALDLDRAGLADLAVEGRPDLVTAYRAATDALTQAMNSTSDREAVRAARSRLDDVIGEVRAAGHTSFLADSDPVPASRGVPEHSTVAYLCASRFGGVALVLADGEHSVVALPGCAADAVTERVRAWRALRDLDPRDGRFAGMLDALGSWSWSAVLQPLFEAVSHRDIRLVPCGQLAELPLHCAWTRQADGNRHHAVDDHAIGYLPSLRVLTPDTSGVGADPWPHAVLVSTAGVQDLDTGHAPLQLPWASAAARTTRSLTEADATVAEVCGSATRADLLHLACHGVSRPARPLDSAIVLHDGHELTLREVMSLRLTGSQERGHTRLVVVSACETDQKGGDLPDEVISLPSGLLQAGAAAVIAAQWRVHSLPVTLLLARFYIALVLESRAPIEALRAAQCWLRDSTNQQLVHDLRHAIGAFGRRGVGDEITSGQLRLVRILEYRDPDARDFTAPGAWASLAYQGL